MSQRKGGPQVALAHPARADERDWPVRLNNTLAHAWIDDDWGK